MDNREKDWFTNKDVNVSNKKAKKKSKHKFSISSESKIVRPFMWIYSTVINGYNWVTDKLKRKELLKKILYTLLLILVFRIAATIVIPGVTLKSGIGQDSGSLIGVLDMMGGGALKNFSIVALGITPYITSSILMQMLQSEIFPPLYRLSRSGPQGKRKINIITRILTFLFAYLQAIVIIQQLRGTTIFADGLDTSAFKYFLLPIILISGSMFALFLGEQITEKGIGNGTSLIIFSGIAAGMPAKFRNAYLELAGGSDNFVGVINFVLYLLIFLGMIYIIGYLYKAERHVPTQKTGAGMTTDVKQMSKLPIKLNPAGVMPVIFAMTFATIPLTIASFMDKQNLTKQWIEKNMSLTAPLGLGIMIFIIFVFTVALSVVTFAPHRVAETFKKDGTFIPGIKPGDETEKYLTDLIIRLSVFSGIYLSAVAASAYIEQIIGLSRGITFSGTSLIILVSVAIETLGQLKARSKSVKITKQKIKTVKSNKDDSSVKGFLW